MASYIKKISEIFSIDTSQDETITDSKNKLTSPTSRHRSRRHRSSSGCILRRWLPVSGAVSYTAFAINVYHPQGLNQYMRSFHTPLANCLLFNSHIGVGVYIFFRPHIRTLPSFHRVMFSVYGSVMFNFGSILLWATTKTVLQNFANPWWIKSLFALCSAVGLLIIGSEYIKYVDALARP